MCGISGFYNPSGLDVKYAHAMTDIIAHRGPDDRGYAYWQDLSSQPETDLSADKKITLMLGHRRLSIVDLSSKGHQPMSYADGRYWLSYNGEVYNYVELREELISLGHSFISETDSEVILAAYAEWGADCLHKFNGMWAFAIYDTQDQNLFLARDRFGIKPLYYQRKPDNSLFFGSEIKQFTALPGWTARLNHQRAYDYLVWGLTDHTDETLFEEVHQLRPGHAIHVDLSESTPENFKIEQWYKLPREITDQPYEEACKDIQRLLKESVQLRLRADVPVGSCLSGGIDSSAIVCLMDNLLEEYKASGKQKTFSALSHHESVNEKKWIDIVIEQTNVDAHSIYPEFENLFETLEKITWHQDEPFGSTSIFAQWHVFALAADHDVTVMLDGQGADEQLAGYHSFFGVRLAELFRSFKWTQMIKEACLIHQKHGHGWGWIIGQFGEAIMPEWIKPALRKIVKRTETKPAWIDFEKLTATQANPRTGNKKTVAFMCHAQITQTNLQMLLHWEDRSSMAHSIEARVPFLDYRLVEKTSSLPSNHKIKNALTKRALRDSMSGILPEEIKNRIDKIGFATPEEIWMKDNKDIFVAKLKDAVETTEGLITTDILNLFEDMMENRRPFSFVIWRIISFATWIRLFQVQIPHGANEIS